jgi:hypothetical protein
VEFFGLAVQYPSVPVVSISTYKSPRMQRTQYPKPMQTPFLPHNIPSSDSTPSCSRRYHPSSRPSSPPGPLSSQQSRSCQPPPPSSCPLPSSSSSSWASPLPPRPSRTPQDRSPDSTTSTPRRRPRAPPSSRGSTPCAPIRCSGTLLRRRRTCGCRRRAVCSGRRARWGRRRRSPWYLRHWYRARCPWRETDGPSCVLAWRRPCFRNGARWAPRGRGRAS